MLERFRLLIQLHENALFSSQHQDLFHTSHKSSFTPPTRALSHLPQELFHTSHKSSFTPPTRALSHLPHLGYLLGDKVRTAHYPGPGHARHRGGGREEEGRRSLLNQPAASCSPSNLSTQYIVELLLSTLPTKPYKTEYKTMWAVLVIQLHQKPWLTRKILLAQRLDVLIPVPTSSPSHIHALCLVVSGLNEVGIFRLPGQASLIQSLKDVYDSGSQQDFSGSEDVHTVASLLKLYLRELPEPVVPFVYYDSYKQALEGA